MPLLSPALGETVPASPHATVVCLPTLADVESYERKERRVWELLRAGYPRFVRNALVTRAAEESSSASTQVLSAADDLSRQSALLSREVDGFLANVRAA